jgi:hypothetical protein
MVYVIDGDDRLEGFDAAFRYFALANGAPDLAEQWVGRSLWQASASSEINMVFRSLVGRARQGRPVSVPTRCDTPHLERFIQMDIAASAGGRVAFRSSVTRARFKRTEAGEPAGPAHDSLRMCAWCFRIEDDGWHGAEHVVAERGLLLGAPLPDVTHGICPDCLAPQLDEADSSILPSPLFRISSPL